jgi:hypothetical protein
MVAGYMQKYLKANNPFSKSRKGKDPAGNDFVAFIQA